MMLLAIINQQLDCYNISFFFIITATDSLSHYTTGRVSVNAENARCLTSPATILPSTSLQPLLSFLSFLPPCAPPGLPPISRSLVSQSGTARGQRDDHNSAAAAVPNTSHQYCRRTLNNLLLAWIYTVAE